MARFFSVEDFLAKEALGGSGTVEDETTDKGADGPTQPLGGDGGDARESDGGDAGDTIGAGAADVADAGSGDAKASSTPKKSTKRA